MIVVSDTSPINYLILIGADQVLPTLFGQVIAPPAVIAEMQSPKAPLAVSRWAANPPAWLSIRSPAPFAPLGNLGPGESEAIALAQQLAVDVLLIDERAGSKLAKRLGINVVRTLGVIDLAAEKGLLLLPAAIAALRNTTFRIPERLVAELLRLDAARTPAKPASPDDSP